MVMMALLALALPDIQMTRVATLDSWERVADIFVRNFPNQWSSELVFQTQAIRFTFELAILCYLDTVSASKHVCARAWHAHLLLSWRCTQYFCRRHLPTCVDDIIEDVLLCACAAMCCTVWLHRCSQLSWLISY